MFPLWPAEEHADACAIDEWSGYEPRLIELSRVTTELLPRFKGDGVLLGVFLAPKNQDVTPSGDELLAALGAESAKY